MNTASKEDWRVALESMALIEVSGDDCVTFLQGQLSNDVTTLGAERPAQLSSLSTARGRVFAVLVVIWRGPNEYALILPQAGVEDVLNRLRMFILRSKVTLTRIEDVHFEGLSGASAQESHVAPSSEADQPWQARWLDEARLAIRWPDPVPRLLLVDLSQRAEGPAADDGRWWQREITAGIAWIVADETREEHVAQMLDLDLLEGISFEKGCYTGQEVIARTHYLGRVKRRLRAFTWDAQPHAAAVPGATVQARNAQGEWQKAGSVVLAAENCALAVMQLDRLDCPLRLVAGDISSDSGVYLTLRALPR